MSLSNFDPLRKQNELLELVRKKPIHRNYWNVYKKIKRLDFSDVEIPSKISFREVFTNTNAHANARLLECVILT